MIKYIASCSFGKDSLATILLAKEHNEPLDLIIWSEVMFDENISGEHPELWEKLRELSKSDNMVTKKFNRNYTFDEFDEFLSKKEKELL